MVKLHLSIPLNNACQSHKKWWYYQVPAASCNHCLPCHARVRVPASAEKRLPRISSRLPRCPRRCPAAAQSAWWCHPGRGICGREGIRQEISRRPFGAENGWDHDKLPIRIRSMDWFKDVQGNFCTSDWLFSQETGVLSNSTYRGFMVISCKLFLVKLHPFCNHHHFQRC